MFVNEIKMFSTNLQSERGVIYQEVRWKNSWKKSYRDSLHLKLYVKTKITKSTDLENINGQTGRLA